MEERTPIETVMRQARAWLFSKDWKGSKVAKLEDDIDKAVATGTCDEALCRRFLDFAGMRKCPPRALMVSIEEVLNPDLTRG